MATEIVAQIDAAWSADKWKIKGRGTHRMIGPQQKKSRLASMCKGQPHGTEWLADHQVAPDHVDVCKSTAAARTCWRNRVILATASFASLSISSATRSFFHRPSTLWCFRRLRSIVFSTSLTWQKRGRLLLLHGFLLFPATFAEVEVVFDEPIHHCKRPHWRTSKLMLYQKQSVLYVLRHGTAIIL